MGFAYRAFEGFNHTELIYNNVQFAYLTYYIISSHLSFGAKQNYSVYSLSKREVIITDAIPIKNLKKHLLHVYITQVFL